MLAAYMSGFVKCLFSSNNQTFFLFYAVLRLLYERPWKFHLYSQIPIAGFLVGKHHLTGVRWSWKEWSLN